MKKIFIFLFAVLFFGFCGCLVSQDVKTADNEIKKTAAVYSLDYVFDDPETAKDELNQLMDLVDDLNQKEQKQLKNYDQYVEIYKTYHRYQKLIDAQEQISVLYNNFPQKLKNNFSETEEKLAAITDLVNAVGAENAEMYLENYDQYEEMLAKYQDYVAEEEQKRLHEAKLQKYFDAAFEYLNAEVPDQWLFENQSYQMNLPSKYEADDGTVVKINWASNRPHTISAKGIVIIPRKTTSVKLTATLECSHLFKTFTKNVIVASIGFKPLPAKPVFAYFYTHQKALTSLEAQTVDVINLSFGSINKNDGSVHVLQMNTEPVLIERMKGIRVIFSVNDKSNFSLWTSTPAKAKKLASEFVKTMEEYHFDGVDIDWEYPSGNEVNNFVTFMKELYTQVKQANVNYLVTAAMAGGFSTAKYNVQESCKYLDYIHLMTYDLNSNDRTTHLTALGGSSCGNNTVIGSINNYISAGVPKKKLVVGGAFYGKYYLIPKNASAFYYTPPSGKPTSISYARIKSEYLDLIGKPGNIQVERQWDASYMAPYLEITTYDQNGDVTEKAFITYDDQESIQLKSEYVFDEDLGGIMFWELGQDTHGEQSLIEPIYDVFKKPR